MSDDTAERFDPRFDPAFQRGFDPAVPIAESISEPVVRPEPTVERVAPAAPATRPAATPPVLQDRPNVQQTSGLPDVNRAALIELPEPEPADTAGLRRNPYLLVLGIIAVVLVIAGIWLFVETRSAFDGREVLAQGDYMSLIAVIDVAPLISMLGGATAIGVLFVIAVRWHRKG